MDELYGVMFRTFGPVLGFALLFGIAVLTTGIVARQRQHRRGELPAQQLQRLQAELMEFARARTKSQDMRVDLKPFWQTKHLTTAQRFVVLEPLFQDKDLRARSSEEDASSGAAFMAAGLLALPARYVSLSELEWNRLKNESAPRIHVHQGSGIVQIGDHNSASSFQELSPEFVLNLIAALRADAGAAAEADGERGSSLADSLEMDLKKKRWSSITETVKTVLSLASSSASLWATTSKLLLG